MPTPVSLTRTTTSFCSRSACRLTVPPRSVYFAALLSKLANTSRAEGDPREHGGRYWPIDCLNESPASSSNGRLISRAASIASPTPIDSILIASFPRVIRETSSKSLIHGPFSNLALHDITCPINRPWIGRGDTHYFELRIADRASGLRSSCAIVARNSSFR